MGETLTLLSLHDIEQVRKSLLEAPRIWLIDVPRLGFGSARDRSQFHRPLNLQEPELLRVDGERIRRQMQEVAVGHYRAFITAADAVQNITHEITAVDEHLKTLVSTEIVSFLYLSILFTKYDLHIASRMDLIALLVSEYLFAKL